MVNGREILPNRREQESIGFEFAGMQFIVSLGRFADGRPAEVFLASNKVTSRLDLEAKNAAIFISMLLQSGYTLTDLRGPSIADEWNRPATIACAILDAALLLEAAECVS